MATTSSSRAISATRTRSRGIAFPILLGVLTLLVGVSLAVTAVSRVAALGSSAPHLFNLVALNESVDSDLGGGAAAQSVDNMAFFLAVAWTAVTAVLLVVAAGLFLSTGHLRHPDAARRVAGVGLWMAVGVALVSVLPFDAGWGAAGLGTDVGTTVAAVQTASLSLAGLLVLQFAAPQWRDSVRRAFRD